MAYASVKIREIVSHAVDHVWSIPEFQRGFVWKSTQVRDLAESLWLDYPIGSLLMWDSSPSTEERVVRDAQRPDLWVVDGQQRATALCILFGRKPFWWESVDDWKKVVGKYDIRFDINAKEPPYFWVANAAIRKAKGNRFIPLSQLLVLDTDKKADQQKLETLAKEIKKEGLCEGLGELEVYTRLDRIRKIRDQDVVTITIDQELEDVVEIFSRLNSRGTRVTEADIYLGVVAAKTPGWVRNAFLPYLRTLAKSGFHVEPNLLFRTLTGVGAKKVRFKEISEAFWHENEIRPHWEHTKRAWKNLLMRFREFGILSNEPMPTEAALVTILALVDKFPDDKFEPALYWFLQASRFGRYSGSGTTSLEEDLRDVQESNSLTAAINRLLRRVLHSIDHSLPPLVEEDFLRDYGDARFGRFLLYLLAYHNKAQDWDDKGYRLGFDGLEALADFKPQWHHIFPRRFLEGRVADEKADALANIAVIGPSINIRISAQNPMNYIDKYDISRKKLAQQYITEEITRISTDEYDAWLSKRAQRLADAGNKFLGTLRDGIDIE